MHPRKKPLVIGVCGGSSSGKVEVCEIIKNVICETHRQAKVFILHSKSFYISLTSQETKVLAREGKFNFDSPSAFHFDQLYDVILKVRQGEPVEYPEYDKKEFCSSGEMNVIDKDVDVLLVEGILIFYDERIRKLFDLKLFVDLDPDLRLCRRIRDDIKEKGSDLTSILENYKNYVKPAFEGFCLPTKRYADVIIPRGEKNLVAIDVIIQHVNDMLWNDSHQRHQYRPQLSWHGEGSIGTMPTRQRNPSRPH